MQRPAIVLAPNKILAAQLYGEFKSFFPNNAVEYFVSYYDYYQPEAYVPRTDTYIEKTSSINEQIDRMRHSATRALFERDDVDHRRLGVLHLRHRLARDLCPDDPDPEAGPEGRAAAAAARPGRAAVPPQRARLLPRRLPRQGRHDRDLPGPSRGPRLAAVDVRRRGREHHRVRPAHRREDRPARPDPALPEQPLRHAASRRCRRRSRASRRS